MERLKPTLRHIVICCSGIFFIYSCSGNRQANKPATANGTAKTAMPKMSAKERLAKNNILERHYNLASMNLQGSVKTRTETGYKLSGEQKVSKGINVDSFDRKGDNIASISYDYENSKLTETGRDSAIFDTNGNAIASYSWKKGQKIKLETGSAYDSHGNEIASTLYDDNGTILWIDSYKYDDKDNLIELDFGSPYMAERKYTYKYDKNGFVTEGASFDTTGKQMSKQIRKYDDKGNFLYSALYRPDGSVDMKDSTRYDDSGHVKEVTRYNADGSLQYREITKNDKKGYLTDKIMYKKDGSIDEDINFTSFYTYEFDSTGNIIRKTKYGMKAGKKFATEITEFAYTYY